MDSRLFKAAQEGNTSELHALLREDALTLRKVALLPYVDTPLHIATLAGKTQFVEEIVQLMPSFAWVRNKDGFTPLHIASANGDIDIVREVLKISPDLCLIKDKGGRTPLHYAAIWGRVDVVGELMNKCSQAVREVTEYGETALHLAVINAQFEALEGLILRLGHEDQRLINAVDHRGKTILQLAQSNKQLKVINLLRNVGLPGTEMTDSEVQEHSLDIMPRSQDTDEDESPTEKTEKSHKFGSLHIKDEFIPVVASLIAQVTYQAGLSPPPTIWKDNMKLDRSCLFKFRFNFNPKDVEGPGNFCAAGRYYGFMAFNTAGFIFALALLVLPGLPLNPKYSRRHAPFLFYSSLYMMLIAYISLLFSMSQTGISLFITIAYVLAISLILYGSKVLLIWGLKKLKPSTLRMQTLQNEPRN